MRYYSNNIAGTVVLIAGGVLPSAAPSSSSSATVYGEPSHRPVHRGFPHRRPQPLRPHQALHRAHAHRSSALDPRWQVVLLRSSVPVGAHPSGRIGEDPKGIPNNLMRASSRSPSAAARSSASTATTIPPRTAPASVTIFTCSTSQTATSPCARCARSPSAAASPSTSAPGSPPPYSSSFCGASKAAGKDPHADRRGRPGDAVPRCTPRRTEPRRCSVGRRSAHHRGVLRGPVGGRARTNIFFGRFRLPYRRGRRAKSLIAPHGDGTPSSHRQVYSRPNVTINIIDFVWTPPRIFWCAASKASSRAGQSVSARRPL